MRINNKKLESFGGIFVSFTYVPPDIERVLQYGGCRHLLVSSKLSTRKSSLVIVFEDSVDKFMSEILDNCVIDIDDGYEYDCILTGTPETKHLGSCIYEMTYPLSTIKRGKERVKHLDKASNMIDIAGAFPCGVKYEITPHYNGNITVGGYTIKNCHDGKKIILDGVNRLIEEEGKNKYSDALFAGFPTLKPGLQTIEVSNTNADIKLRYHPVYL